MFDERTSGLIRESPALRGVDPALLSQELTQVYAELAALRIRNQGASSDPELSAKLNRLRRIAIIYEAAVDKGAVGEARRGAAFVAGTAYGILARAFADEVASARTPLATCSIDPAIAAPLLFLVAEQNSDANEAARLLDNFRSDELLISALVESIRDLATEQFEAIIRRAERLRRTRPPDRFSVTQQATQALYGLCWSGIVQATALLLDRATPGNAFSSFETPQLVFDEVVRLSTQRIDFDGGAGQLISSYSGPRHLARLLRHVVDSLSGTGIAGLPNPEGTNAVIWKGCRMQTTCFCQRCSRTGATSLSGSRRPLVGHVFSFTIYGSRAGRLVEL